MKTLATLAEGIFLPPVAAWFWSSAYRLFGMRRLRFLGAWIGSATGGGLASAFHRDWWYLTGSTVSLAVALAVWWWRRKKRRNALALLGAKARAARDALVRKAREAAQPRPVLRPVPQAR